MPRSSKHKSSKHDTREHSDSERDSGRKRKDESAATTKASRDSDDHGSSKRPKDGGSDDGNDGGGGGGREWWVGGEDEQGEGSRKAAKARRWEEKERMVKEGRSERPVENEELRTSKRGYENNDSKKLDELQSAELDNQRERQIRKKRDYSDGDKHRGDVYDRQLTSRDEIVKDTRQKEHRRRDGKYRDNYREEMDRENKHQHDKQQDDNPPKDHASIKSDDKHATEEKDSLESREKRIKLSEGNCGQVRKYERYNDRVHDCDYDKDRDWYRDQDRDRDWDRDHKNDCGYRHDLDDQSAPSKDRKTENKTTDEYDGYGDIKPRDIKGQYPDGEKRSLSGGRADSDVDRGRSLPQNRDLTGTCNKHRSTPATNKHIGKDRYRNANSEGLMYRDLLIEQRIEGSREGYSGISVRGHKYKSTENSIKIDDGPVGDLSTERPSTAKAAPKGFMERSPSTTVERRYLNKNDVRQSLEIEESGRRNIIGARDFSSSDDRQGRELTLKKPQLDKPPQAESSFYCGTSQSNVSLVPPPPAFQAALDRPFMGSVEDNARNNSSTQYKRSIDPGFRRGHGNSWMAVPNWISAVPNGFVSFQPGPAQGGFQTMLPQFAAQPLFGIRPSIEVNQAGNPYHIADANRFPAHLRPIGWQNVMDGTAPAHLRRWESNDGVFRDGGSDWNRNRHLTNISGWDSGRETWKEQNGDSKKDVPFPSCKDESVPSQEDDFLSYQAIQVSRDDEHKDDFHEKSLETKSSSLGSPAKVPLNSLSTIVLPKVPDSLTPSDNTYLFSRFYLSKLDISADLVMPELYNQCMCVVNVGSVGSIDADSTAKLFQKNGSRAPNKYAATFSRHSPFPAIDNSIFQRAIDLYMKQRVELPNGGKVDISAYQQVLVDEPAPIKSLENQQVTASVSDGTADVPMSLLEQKKLEALSPAKENLEEIDQTSCQMVQDHEKQRGPVAGLREKEDEDTSEMEDLGDAEENNLMALKNESQLAPTFHNDADDLHSKSVQLSNGAGS